MRALPKSMRQKMKLLYLIDIFSRESDDEHVLSINDLIRRLDSLGIKSERKSIYNDIDCLREYGVDIERRDGKNGGYHGRTLRNQSFSRESQCYLLRLQHKSQPQRQISGG